MRITTERWNRLTTLLLKDIVGQFNIYFVAKEDLLLRAGRFMWRMLFDSDSFPAWSHSECKEQAWMSGESGIKCVFCISLSLLGLLWCLWGLSWLLNVRMLPSSGRKETFIYQIAFKDFYRLVSLFYLHLFIDYLTVYFNFLSRYIFIFFSWMQ